MLVLPAAAQASIVEGKVYDARTGEPARGVRLEVFYDENDPIEPDQRVPDDRLASGQQGQNTGPSGEYLFDLPSGRLYRLEVRVDRNAYAFPAVDVPPLRGYATSGDIVAEDDPSTSGSRPFFLRFDVSAAANEYRNNHIAIDRLRSVASLEHRADRQQASVGDVVRFTAIFENGSSRDLTSSAGRPVLLELAPPRGFRVDPGSAVAMVERDGRLGPSLSNILVRETGTAALMRLGPFDVPAGAKLTMHYQATVGVDTRPGRYDSRITATGPGGVAVADPASVAVAVTTDHDLGESVVLGRVFCDHDGNEAQGEDEPGLFGARVYLDSGSYAVTDPSGLFHFSRVEPGSHVLKLDPGSLAGGKIVGDERRFLQLTEGLPARTLFAVSCAQVWVGVEHERADLFSGKARPRYREPEPADASDDEPPATATVRGWISPMQLAVDGRLIDLPSVDLVESFPDSIVDLGRGADHGADLRPMPAAGYGTDTPSWRVTWNEGTLGVPQAWHFTIERLEAGGLAPVFRSQGTGAPPSILTWTGQSDSGLPIATPVILAARITVVGENGVEAASRRMPFGIGVHAATRSQSVEWRGDLFGGTARAPSARPGLRTRVASLRASWQPGQKIVIASHWNGQGDRLQSLARTKREAELIAKMLVDAGIPADHVDAQGRGDSEPLVEGAGAAARRENRRVIVEVTALSPSIGAVPLEVNGASELRVDGRVAPVASDGSFEVGVPLGRSLAVDLLAPSGRRAAVRVVVTQGDASKPAAPPRRNVSLSGDVSATALQVDFDAAPSGLWNVDARLAAVGGLVTPELATEGKGPARRLSSPLDFQLQVPDSLTLSHWELVVADAEGNAVHRHRSTEAPPPVLRWDAVLDGALVLGADKQYFYWLSIETQDGSSASSPRRSFYVDPAQSSRVLDLQGRLFDRPGRPRAALRSRLSRFVSRLRREPSVRYQIHVEVAGDRPRVDAVAAALVEYLGRMSVAPQRYTLSTREITGGSDSVSIVVDVEPPQKAARVLVNGRSVPLTGQRFDSAIDVEPGASVVVEVEREDSSRVRFVAAAPKGHEERAAGGELLGPSEEGASTRVREAHFKESLAVADAAHLRVLVPPEDAVLGEHRLAVKGWSMRGTRLTINGKRVPVQPSGRFETIVDLPVGPSTLVIRARDREGVTAKIDWPVEVERSHHVVVGLVEGIASTSYTSRGWLADTAWLSGMTNNSTVQLGPVLLSGRARGYLKARLPGGGLADSVNITAHVDTGRERAGAALFEQMVDPLRDQPIYGDTAEEVRDANTRGRAYARVEVGDSSAVLGSVHTKLQGASLFRYDRTADGAVVHIERDVGESDSEIRVRGFATSGTMDSARDINWFRSTGGSLYFLRHSYVLEGSEEVRVVVRDRDSGLELESKVLTRQHDYVVDYSGGRILLTHPLRSTQASTWFLDNYESSTTPMTGQPVYLVVRYEHRDRDGLEQQAGGVYASTNLEKRLHLGAGVVSEKRGIGDDYSLWGADASLSLGKRSVVRAEIAGSREQDAGHFMSMDGGLTFGDLQRTAQLAGSYDGGTELGWKVDALLALSDWSDAEDFEDSTLAMYVQDLDRGFASENAILDQGRLKFGATAKHRLGPNDLLLLRHDGLVAKLPQVGPTLADVAAATDAAEIHERATYMTSLQWLREHGRWNYRLEGMHQRVSATLPLASGDAAVDGRRFGVGGVVSYDYTERLALRAGQQLIFGVRDADPTLSPITPMMSSLRTTNPLAGVVTNVGTELLLAPELALGADYFQRWNGDNAAQVGLKTSISETGTMYVQERAYGSAGRLQAATVIGAQDRFGADGGGRTYGEYQIDKGISGFRNRAVLGLGRRWQVGRGLGLGLGFEHQQAFGGYLPDGTPVGNAQRNVFHSSMDFVRKSRFKLAGQLELRLDNGARGDEGIEEELLTEDPRAIAGDGAFADHGGVLPGSPLVIPPGKRMQWLVGLGATYKVARDHSLLSRARLSTSTLDRPGLGDADRTTEAYFAEWTTGWAYRPVKHDWLDLLARYSVLTSQRPIDAQGLLTTDRSHVFALLPMAELPWRLTLSGKLAFKSTEAETQMARPESTSTVVSAVLAVLRLGYRFYGRWDASVEARALELIGDGIDESKSGTLLEVGYTIARQLRLGAGYNLSHFSDNELGDLTRDSHGFFVRVTGQF